MSRLIEIPLLKTNGLGNVLSTMGGGGSGGGIPGPTGPTGDAGSKSTYVYAPNYVDTLPVGTYVSWEALMDVRSTAHLDHLLSWKMPMGLYTMHVQLNC